PPPGPPLFPYTTLFRSDGPRDPRDTGERPRRSVIEAVALFPGTTSAAEFRTSRLWRTIDRIGIGAIPLLPDNDELLREWLRSALDRKSTRLNSSHDQIS